MKSPEKLEKEIVQTQKKLTTVQTYNKSADALAEKFDSLGARVEDVEETFKLVDKANPKVLEVGCGNGRDAEEIIKRTTDYLGVDISERLIELARKKVPEGRFEVADIEGYQLQQGLDIIFAFASLLHIPKESLKDFLSEAYSALNNKGVIRLSLKSAKAYTETTTNDEFGTRTYFLYSPEDVKDLAANFSIVKSDLLERGGQLWLEVILQKP